MNEWMNEWMNEYLLRLTGSAERSWASRRCSTCTTRGTTASRSRLAGTDRRLNQSKNLCMYFLFMSLSLCKSACCFSVSLCFFSVSLSVSFCPCLFIPVYLYVSLSLTICVQGGGAAMSTLRHIEDGGYVYLSFLSVFVSLLLMCA